jgi:hypothetical protein
MLSSLKNTINNTPLVKTSSSAKEHESDSTLPVGTGKPGQGPPPLDKHLALVVGIAAKVAVLSPEEDDIKSQETSTSLAEREAWLDAVCGHVSGTLPRLLFCPSSLVLSCRLAS